MRENVEPGGGAVSILLSGAELAEFKTLSNLQLYWSQGEAEEEPFESREVELRSKSGISVESSAVPFSLWNRGESSSCDAGFPAGFSSSNGENRLKLVDSERFPAPTPPIVLKSRAVVEAEKQSRPVRAQDRDSLLLPERKKISTTKHHKQRAVSMDESSLSQRMNGGEDFRDDPFSRSRRFTAKKSEQQNPLPLPLPPPPGSSPLAGKSLIPPPPPPEHRRHVSIDLRASPAAKFLVQIMPWEMPEDHHSSSFSGRHSAAERCFVPFKWEEVPGKPKSLSLSTNNTAANNGLGFNKLRLPPRLQQVYQSDQPGGINVDLQKPVVSSSPTSILDQGRECSQSSMDSSSTSSPNARVAEEIHETEKRRFQVHSKVRAFLALVTWTRRGFEEDGKSGCVPKKKKKKSSPQKLKNPASYQSISSSWSPSPRSSWFRSYSGLEIQHQRGSNNNRRRRRRMRRMDPNNSWGLGKLTSGCSLVSKAVRFRWWRRSSTTTTTTTTPSSTGSSSRVKLSRKSVYKPLLCSVGDESAAFACS